MKDCGSRAYQFLLRSPQRTYYMQERQAVTVQITFQTPTRSDSPGAPTIHERCIEGVPKCVATEMTRDLERYQRNPCVDNQWKLYKYEKEGEESKTNIVTPIDFGEVVGIGVT